MLDLVSELISDVVICFGFDLNSERFLQKGDNAL